MALAAPMLLKFCRRFQEHLIPWGPATPIIPSEVRIHQFPTFTRLGNTAYLDSKYYPGRKSRFSLPYVKL